MWTVKRDRFANATGLAAQAGGGGLVLVLFVLGVLLIPVLWWVAVHNGFVRKRNQCSQAFSTIDVQLKKRHDLVPSLVAAVKGSMKHERELLEDVARLRQEAVSAVQGADAEHAEGVQRSEQAMASGLGRLFALAEGYPDLKSSGNFLQLQKSLAEIEAQIAAARRAYNSAATVFNNGLEMFPSSIVGNSMNLKTIQLFEALEMERAPIEVDLDS